MKHDAVKLASQLKSAALEHERLNSLVNSMADGVIAIDEAQRVVLYNGASLNILDINTPMNGKLLANMLPLVDSHSHPVNVHSLINETTVPYTSREFSVILSDKSRLRLYLSIAPVKLGYGKQGTKGHVILLRDITREKSLEEERDEFISVLSHELRTPVAIAEGNISNAQVIAQKESQSNNIQDSLQQAHDQIIFLSQMINDLSMLSRAEQGTLSFETEPINVHQLVAALLSSYDIEAKKKNLHLKSELDPRLELLTSSQLYVKEILQNFMTNAIKYTESGMVTLIAKQKQGAVEFTIADTGIGISISDQEKIFNKFFRSEDYRTRQNNGTGLGLYVTVKLAHLIHAKISLKSQLNKGSEFSILIPSLKVSP